MTQQIQETARQMFMRADNDEGFIAVIAHRSRDLPALQALGFGRTPEEAAEINKAGGDSVLLTDLQSQNERLLHTLEEVGKEKESAEMKVLELEEAAQQSAARITELEAQLNKAQAPAPAADTGKKNK